MVGFHQEKTMRKMSAITFIIHQNQEKQKSFLSYTGESRGREGEEIVENWK